MNNKFIPAARFLWLNPIFDSLCSIIGLGKRYRAQVIKTLPITKGKKLKVLDAGCGTGSLAVEVKKKYPKIELYAIDIDDSILERAIKKSKKEKVIISFKKTPIQNTEFPENYFDYIYTSLVLHHLKTKDKQKAIKELHRILKRGGTLIVSDFGKPKNIVQYTVAWFTVLMEEGRDNYRGKIPSMLEEQFKKVKILKRYGLIEMLQGEK